MKNAEIIFDTLAEAIRAKNDKITVCEWELETLRKKLDDAEKHIAELEAKNAGVLCNKNIEFRKGNAE